MGFKIAVLMGGASFEREFSLASGRQVCDALKSAGYVVVPLDTTSALVPTLRSEKPAVVYSALHGKHGEDGTIQSLMEMLGLPLVGSPAPVARNVYNKAMRAHRLATYRATHEGQSTAAVPEGISLTRDAFKDMGAATALDLITERAGGAFPLVVKPARGGSAMGLHKVTEAAQLGEALLDALSFDEEVIVERWIDGVEVAVSLYEKDGELIALPPVEIAPKEGIYDTDARLNEDAVDYFAPPRKSSLGATDEEAAQTLAALKDAAIEVYRAYGMKDMGRVDMIWDGANAYVLEANVSPGMTELSLFPMACMGADTSLSDVLDTLVRSAAVR